MIPRYAPIKRKRARRRGPWRSESYRRYIASLPCIICQRPETQAAHTERCGMSIKGSDASCVPLCVGHHDLLDGRRKFFTGETGRGAFERLLKIDLNAIAEAYHEGWTRSREVAK